MRTKNIKIAVLALALVDIIELSAFNGLGISIKSSNDKLGLIEENNEEILNIKSGWHLLWWPR